MFIQSVEVFNIDGEIQYKLGQEGHSKKNINTLFQEIRNALYSAYSAKITYSELGYPLSYSIDWSKSTIDDECFVKISEFRIF